MLKVEKDSREVVDVALYEGAIHVCIVRGPVLALRIPESPTHLDLGLPSSRDISIYS